MPIEPLTPPPSQSPDPNALKAFEALLPLPLDRLEAALAGVSAGRLGEHIPGRLGDRPAGVSYADVLTLYRQLVAAEADTCRLGVGDVQFLRDAAGHLVYKDGSWVGKTGERRYSVAVRAVRLRTADLVAHRYMPDRFVFVPTRRGRRVLLFLAASVEVRQAWRHGDPGTVEGLPLSCESPTVEV